MPFVVFDKNYLNSANPNQLMISMYYVIVFLKN